MEIALDDVLKQLQEGRISRRQALCVITALAASPAFSESSPPTLFKARTLDHINITVSDAGRSEAFYRTVLGLPAGFPIPPKARGVAFPGGGFLSLCPLDGQCFLGDPQTGRIDHFGVGIEDFDADRVARDLEAADIEVVLKTPGSVFAHDPDGVVVQLSPLRPETGA